MVEITEQALKKIKDFHYREGARLVLFGEAHGMLQETKIQEKILEIFPCDVFMYEMLEDKFLITKKEQEDFLSKQDQEDFSIISKNQELKPTILLAKKFNLPLIGCDLKNMGRKDTNFQDENSKEEQELMRGRELIQFQRIKQEMDKGKRVFASVGIYHILPRSKLIKNLKKEKVLIVYPIFKSGEIFGYKQYFNLEEVEYTTKEIWGYLEDESKN
jgi:hypothetical protein